MNLSYSELMNIPTFERRYFINKKIESNEDKKERMEESKQAVSSGKGKRTTKISGESVKKFSGKNNTI